MCYGYELHALQAAFEKLLSLCSYGFAEKANFYYSVLVELQP